MQETPSIADLHPPFPYMPEDAFPGGLHLLPSARVQRDRKFSCDRIDLRSIAETKACDQLASGMRLT